MTLSNERDVSPIHEARSLLFMNPMPHITNRQQNEGHNQLESFAGQDPEAMEALEDEHMFDQALPPVADLATFIELDV